VARSTPPWRYQPSDCSTSLANVGSTYADFGTKRSGLSSAALTSLTVYLDVSLKTFDLVYPAGGSLNTSVEVPTERLFDLVGERWVDLCRLRDEAVGT